MYELSASRSSSHISCLEYNQHNFHSSTLFLSSILVAPSLWFSWPNISCESMLARRLLHSSKCRMTLNTMLKWLIRTFGAMSHHADVNIVSLMTEIRSILVQIHHASAMNYINIKYWATLFLCYKYRSYHLTQHAESWAHYKL